MIERGFAFDVDAALQRILAAKEQETSTQGLSQRSQLPATVASKQCSSGYNAASGESANKIRELRDRSNPDLVDFSDLSQMSQLSQPPILAYVFTILDEEEIGDFYYYAGGFEYDDGMCRSAAEHRALERIFSRRCGNEP